MLLVRKVAGDTEAAYECLRNLRELEVYLKLNDIKTNSYAKRYLDGHRFIYLV